MWHKRFHVANYRLYNPGKPSVNPGTVDFNSYCSPIAGLQFHPHHPISIICTLLLWNFIHRTIIILNGLYLINKKTIQSASHHMPSQTVCQFIQKFSLPDSPLIFLLPEKLLPLQELQLFRLTKRIELFYRSL